jgi:hypothetical protein
MRCSLTYIPDGPATRPFVVCRYLLGQVDTIIECLLLQPVEERTASYIRAGLLKVSVNLKDKLPEEIKWIPEVFLSNSNTIDLETIFLY